MIIGFDLDDILLDFQDTLRGYHNIQYGTNYKREDDNVWNLWERWSCTPEDSKQRVFDFYEHEMHLNALPIYGSMEGINTLKNNNELFVITARPESMKEKTLEWLNKHFPQAFQQVVFTNLFYGDGNKRNKSDVCKELGVEIFVEDALHNAYDVAEAGIPVLLLDAPWNQSEVKPPITRVYSWEEIVQKLNS